MLRQQLFSKSMLLIAVMVAGVTNAWAETKTITLDYSAFGLTTSYATRTTSVNDISFTVDKGYKGSNNSIQMNSNQGSGVLYNTTAIIGLKSIKVNVFKGSNTYTITSGTTRNPTANSQTGSTTGIYYVTSGDTYFQLKVSGASYFSSIVITYDDGTLAMPIINPTSGPVAYGTSVTLTQNDAAMIMFTTDGSTPSYVNNIGQEYTNPISITSTTTIKAIAVDEDGNESEVAEASYTIATPTAPTFTPASGKVFTGTTVELSANVDKILYTTDGSVPTNKNNVGIIYRTPITINTPTTIKAISVDGAGNESEVVTAEYSIKVASKPMTIDFEKEQTLFKDWKFTNIFTTNSTDISAHGGSQWGKKELNQETASVQTKNKVNPDKFTCYVSKTSNNTNTSNWYIQVSDDGVNWTEVVSRSATDMPKGEWVVFTANLSDYTDVYVRLYYNGSTAARAIDDIELTTLAIPVGPIHVGPLGYATYSNISALDFANSDVTAYTVKYENGSAKLTAVEQVPANNGVVLKAKEGTYYVGMLSSADELSNNDLQVSDGTKTGNGTYFCLANGNNGVGFYRVGDGVTIPAGKCYLEVPSSSRQFIGFDDNTTSIDNATEEVIVRNGYFDLQGRQVAKPTKGLYIVNGKKVIIK